MSRILRGLLLMSVVLAVAVSSSAAQDEKASGSEKAKPARKDGSKTGKSKRMPRGRRGSSRAEAAAKAAATETPMPADGQLKFSRDIAPILVNNCGGCHNPRLKRGKFDMSTFEKLMEGTPDEKVIAPGKPEESHLVLRIKGEETPKMPQGANRTLSAASIAKITAWVKAGAVLDAGIDRKAPMQKYAASVEDVRKAELAKLPADQRDKQVETVGLARWKKADPKGKPEVTSGAHFVVFGSLPKERASAALKAVEAQLAPVKALVGSEAVDWGEKVSLYVFNDAASFGEFVRTAENREVEAGDVGTSRLNVPQPYVAVLDPLGGKAEPAGSATKRSGRSRKGAGAGSGDEDSGDGRTLSSLLVEHFAGGAAARAGQPPRWVTLGVGALVASRAEKRGPYLQKLRREAMQLCEQGWPSRANDALGDAAKTEDVRAVGFALLDWLSSVDSKALPEFIAGMSAGGEKLDDVIARVLNGSREQFLALSGLYVGNQYAR